tara:strand:- start:232 stop:549 length:318 start_codon:yes stop_codon:yes gene_type:complete
MTYVFDIDGTICELVSNGNYENAIPKIERIEKINCLYDEGNIIILQTARGMGRHNNNVAAATEDFYDMTNKQMKSWGVKFHYLFLGKPAADVYVDDKGEKDVDFF